MTHDDAPIVVGDRVVVTNEAFNGGEVGSVVEIVTDRLRPIWVKLDTLKYGSVGFDNEELRRTDTSLPADKDST